MSRRVLFVDHADWMGGAEQNLLLLMAHLDRRRFEPVLAAAPASPLARAARELGIEVQEVPLARLRGRRSLDLLPAWWKGVTALRHLLRQGRFDILHSNTQRASLYAAPAARLAGVPLVWHVHDIHVGEPLYCRLMSRCSTAIVAISSAVAAPLPAGAQRKLFLIPNGIDVDRFRPDAPARRRLRAAMNVPEEALLLGNAGWIAPWKQVELFLEVARRVAPALPPAHCWVIGDIPDARYAGYLAGLQKQARRHLGDRCRFLGAREDMPAVMAALDILVHTARAEPFGRVLMEAMAAGVPVVAFADGGVPDVVRDGETGILIPPGDVERMARAVRELGADAERRRRMGQAGRAHVASHFSAEAVARQMEQVYERVLAGRR